MNHEIYEVVSTYGIQNFSNLTPCEKRELALVMLRQDALLYVLDDQDYADKLTKELIIDLENDVKSNLVEYMVSNIVSINRNEILVEIDRFVEELDNERFYECSARFGSDRATYNHEVSDFNALI